MGQKEIITNTKINLKVLGVTQETSDAITIHFEQPQEKLQYQSGQFLTLIITVNGQEQRRAYSLCSSPYTDENLSVTVKRVKGGESIQLP